ncbi:MAG: hypothetical protein WC707_06795 [Candidatus Babeliaceae bacterium]|jgi:hypothetical protein
MKKIKITLNRGELESLCTLMYKLPFNDKGDKYFTTMVKNLLIDVYLRLCKKQITVVFNPKKDFKFTFNAAEAAAFVVQFNPIFREFAPYEMNTMQRIITEIDKKIGMY